MPLNRADRQLLLQWGRGDLRRLRGRGTAPLAVLTSAERISPLYAAGAEVERIKAANKTSGVKTDLDATLEAVANKWKVDLTSLGNLIGRSRAYKLRVGILHGSFNIKLP